MLIPCFTLLFTLVHGMTDTTCFKPGGAFEAKVLIQTLPKDTERACQIACADDNKECTAYNYSIPSSKCFLLGEPVDGSQVLCSGGVFFGTKVEFECNDRVDNLAEMGEDPCITVYHETKITNPGQTPVCVRDERNLVIRAVDEFGNRTTYDNQVGNMVSFDFERNMWLLSNDNTGIRHWMVAVTCAETNNDYECGCDRLPSIDASFGIQGGVDLMIGGEGTCEDPTYEMMAYGDEFRNGRDPRSFDPEAAASLRLTCQAGIWLLTHESYQDGAQVKNATCYPTQGRAAP